MFILKKIQMYILLFVGIHAGAQPSLQYSLDSLAGAFIQNVRLTEPIQSYIHTDKSIYRAGETIWARAFLLNSLSQRISTSTFLIAELVNAKDSAVKQLLLDAANQQLTARIQLPATLPTGFYWLRTYTMEMTRSDSISIYSHPIYVINPALQDRTASKNLNNPTIQEPVHVRFFPEGGSIMTGTNSVVAFHITDNSGNPVAVSGSVKDNRDSIVAHFASNEFGVGRFEFFPYRARRYTATIRYKEKQYTYPLPPFNFFASQLAITDSQKGIKRVRVLLEDSLYRKDYVTFLIGVSRDSLCFAGIGRGNYELNVPINQFPGGIATFYLFNQQNRLLSERSFYVQEENVLLNVAPDNSVYGKRSKVIMSVSVSDRQSMPVASSLSISATEKSLSSVDQSEILYAAFFRQNDPVIRQWAVRSSTALNDTTLQLLMLTQRSTFIPFLDRTNQQSVDDHKLFFGGKVIDANGKSASNKTLTIFTGGQSMVFETVTTDSAGKFRIPANNIDSTRLNVQLNGIKDKPEAFEIILDTFRLPQPVPQDRARPTFKLQPSTISGYFDKWENVFAGNGKEWLKPVLIKSKRNTDLFYESKRISPSSFIIPSSAFEKGGNGSVRNAVMRTPGLAISKGYLVMRGLNSTTAVTANAEPIIAMNGIVLHLPGEDINGVSPVLNFLNSLNPSDIEFIEVLRGPEGATFGTRGGNGVIVIHTSNTLKQENDTKSNIKSFYINGYHNPTLFPVPNYNIKDLKNASGKDTRSTIYWNGNLITGENGKIEIIFYTNDISGVYLVTVKGITVRGDLLYKTIEFTVK